MNHGLGFWIKRRVIVQHEGYYRGQNAHQPVPHHPAAGREIKEPVGGLKICVNLVFLQMLNARAVSTLDNALGHAGGPARRHSIQRMIERQRFKAKCRAALNRKIILGNRSGYIVY